MAAALQAYMLVPCPESQAAASTLLAHMQPSGKLLKTLLDQRNLL